MDFYEFPDFYYRCRPIGTVHFCVEVGDLSDVKKYLQNSPTCAIRDKLSCIFPLHRDRSLYEQNTNSCQC
jgi:hypothetical protein